MASRPRDRGHFDQAHLHERVQCVEQRLAFGSIVLRHRASVRVSGFEPIVGT